MSSDSLASFTFSSTETSAATTPVSLPVDQRSSWREEDVVIYVVDDDLAILRLVEQFIQPAPWRTETYLHPQKFLDKFDPKAACCVVADVCMPGMNGLELLDRVQRRPPAPPVVVMSANGDIPMTKQALQHGALDFIEKPLDREALTAVLKTAMEIEQRRQQWLAQRRSVEFKMERLTPRESEVRDMLIDGKSTKQIASTLGVTFQTAAKHRVRVLDKLDVEGEMELLRLVLSIEPKRLNDSPSS